MGPESEDHASGWAVVTGRSQGPLGAHESPPVYWSGVWLVCFIYENSLIHILTITELFKYVFYTSVKHYKKAKTNECVASEK